MSLRPVRVAFRCIKALGSMECMSPRTWPISWAATWTRSVSQTPATETAQLGVCCIHYFTHEILKVSANTIKMRAFLPAEAHVSQNPIFVVVKVDLACWREERVSQFSCDAIETMVQVGLPTVCVVDWIEACQNRETERNSSEPRRESLRPSFLHRGDWSGEMMDHKRQTQRMTTIPLTHSENLCRTLVCTQRGQIKGNLGTFAMSWYVWKLLDIFFH